MKALLNSDLQISNKYKENIIEIGDKLKELSSFTNNLQQKIDELLHRQQLSFFQSYKIHFKKIENIVQILQKKNQEQNKKILQYQSGGTVANIIKKNIQFQKHLTLLYSQITQQQKVIKQQKIQISLVKNQKQQLSRKLKNYIKQKGNQKVKQKSYLIIDDLQNPQGGGIFTTQIKSHKQKQNSQIIKEKSINKFYEQQIQKLQNQKKQISQKYNQLYKKYQNLVNQNINITTRHGQLQQFFLNCVNQIKKNICTRNSIKKCDLKDFKKQDKLNVILLALSNQEIKQYLMNKIFNKTTDPYVIQQRTIQTSKKKRSKKSCNQICVQDEQQNKLPGIEKGKNKVQKIFF